MSTADWIAAVTALVMLGITCLSILAILVVLAVMELRSGPKRLDLPRR